MSFLSLMFAAGYAAALEAPDRWWKFDDGSGTVASDSSGNDVHGTLVNGPVWTTGLSGGALQFDGIDDYVAIPDNLLPTPGYYNDGDFTIAFLVMLSKDAQMSLVRRSTEDAAWWANGRTVHVAKSGSGPMHIEAYAWDGTDERATGTTPLMTGVWYHVAMVCDVGGNAGGLRVYLDGQLEASAWMGAPGGWPQDSWFIGRALTSKGYEAFGGIIDDVRVYNRRLSDQEIAELCEATYPKPEVHIIADDPSAGEPSDTGTCKVVASRSPASNLTIHYTVSGTATPGQDFVSLPGTVTIPAGQTETLIIVTPLDDSVPEPDEELTITISPGGGYIVSVPDSASITIADNDQPGPFTLQTPQDEQENVLMTPTLSWTASNRAATYSLTITDGASFSLVVQDIPTNQYTVSASDGLLPDTRYSWSVTAHNSAGDTDASNNPLHFWTTKVGAPSITGTSPADGTTGVRRDIQVRVFFSEPMEAGSTLGALSVVDSLGNPVAVAKVMTSNGMVLAFTPQEELACSETYTVSIASSAADLAGNQLGTSYSFSFTTEGDLPGLGAQVPGCATGTGSAYVLVLALASLIFLRRSRWRIRCKLGC